MEIDFATVVPKFDAILERGLGQGLGKPDGEMCVEAAICQALGLPHGDDPKCVVANVRSFKIGLNDCNWSSALARAKGLRDLGIAQLGSRGVVDGLEFSTLVSIKFIKELVPVVYRDVFKDYPAEFLKEVQPYVEKLSSGKLEDLQYLNEFLFKHGFSFCSTRQQFIWIETFSKACSCILHMQAYSWVDYNWVFVGHVSTISSCLGDNPDKYLVHAAKIGLEVLQALGSPGCKYI